MIDSHAHVDNEQFNEDRDAVFERAWEAGLSHVVLIGMVPAHAATLALAEARPDRVRCAMGVHPHDCRAWSPETEAMLAAALEHPAVTVLGECGLDWFRDYGPADVQIACYTRQLEMARERNLPFVLHCREAFDDCLRIIHEVFGSEARPRGTDEKPLGVAHCFSGTADHARRFVECGMLISFAGQLTYKKKSEELQEAARQIAPAHMLVETDCPYLAPVPKRGRRNEPAYVVHTAARLAELTGRSVEEIDRLTTANAIRCFDLPVDAGKAGRGGPA